MEENKEVPTEPVKEKHRPEKVKKPGLGSKLKAKLVQYRRTMEVARKPDRAEFLSSMRIITIGMAIVGVIGFLMFLLFSVVVWY